MSLHISKKPKIFEGYANLFFLIAGVALVLAISNLPYWYYKALRYLICCIGIYGTYLNNKCKNIKWVCIFVVIAVIFNPFFKINIEKGAWELIDIIAAICCFITFFKGKMDKTFWILSKWCVWCLVLLIFGFGFYVNNFLPHGPPIKDSIDEVCSEETGACSTVYAEDLNGLNMSKFAKILRKDGVNLLLFLFPVGLLLSFKSLEKDELEFNG